MFVKFRSIVSVTRDLFLGDKVQNFHSDCSDLHYLFKSVHRGELYCNTAMGTAGATKTYLYPADLVTESVALRASVLVRPV